MNGTNGRSRRTWWIALAALWFLAGPVLGFRMIQNNGTGRFTSGSLVACNDPGGFVHWTDPAITWHLNPALQGVDKALSMQNALNTWTNVPSADHVLSYGGITKAGFATDGINTALWAFGNGCSGNCLALTALVLQAGQELVEADITFNNFQTFTTNGANFDTQGVMLHELGHSLGIHHTELTSTPRPTMFAFYDAGWRSLEPDDRAALQCAQSRYPFVTNQPPVANFTNSGRLEHTLDGRSSSDDNGIVSYQWTFPGGVQRSGAVVSHFFERYGSHSVTLTVTDTDGVSASRTRNIFLPEPNLTPSQGLFYNPDRSGHGIEFYRNASGAYTVVWYTYTASGTPIWYISGTGNKGNATWSQPLYRTTWNGSSATLTNVGSVQLAFDDARDAWFSWTLDGQSGGERFRFLHGGAGRSGLWYPPSESGWGLNVSEASNVLVATVYFYQGSQPRWVQGQATASGNAFVPVTWFNGTGLCPSCTGGSATPPPGASAGSIRVQIASGSSITGTLSTSIQMPSGATWNRSNIPIAILTQP